MISEEKISNYMEKIQAIEDEKESTKTAIYLQAKIEAHLEMLCLLGFMDALDAMKKKK